MILATTVYTNTFLSLTPSSLNLKRKYRTKGLECHGSMSLAKCTVVVYALLYFDIQQAPRIIPPGFERGKLSTKVMTRAAVATACLADDEFGNRVTELQLRGSGQWFEAKALYLTPKDLSHQPSLRWTINPMAN